MYRRFRFKGTIQVLPDLSEEWFHAKSWLYDSNHLHDGWHDIYIVFVTDIVQILQKYSVRLQNRQILIFRFQQYWREIGRIKLSIRKHKIISHAKYTFYTIKLSIRKNKIISHAKYTFYTANTHLISVDVAASTALEFWGWDISGEYQGVSFCTQHYRYYWITLSLLLFLSNSYSLHNVNVQGVKSDQIFKPSFLILQWNRSADDEA
jgi:hypothetical protein